MSVQPPTSFTPPPACAPPPPPTELVVQEPQLVHSVVVVDEFSPSVVQPSRLTNDVWAYLQEFRSGGGLLDPSEEIAALTQLEEEVRADKKMKPGERAKHLIKIVTDRAKLKQMHLTLMKEKRDFLTLDLFVEFLEELHGILTNHLGDPFLLKAVGADIMLLAQRMHAKMGSK